MNDETLNTTPALETTPETETKKTREKKTQKVGATKVTATGTYVHATKGEVEYTTDVVIPRREGWRAYLQESVLTKLRASDANIQHVITFYVDDEKDTETDVSFLGKTPFDLTREELFAAKCYYGLRSIQCHEDKRAAQTTMYRRLCSRLGLKAPESDDNVKQWPTLKLLPLVTPEGDELRAMTFEERDGVWIKHVFAKDPKKVMFKR